MYIVWAAQRHRLGSYKRKTYSYRASLKTAESTIPPLFHRDSYESRTGCGLAVLRVYIWRSLVLTFEHHEDEFYTPLNNIACFASLPAHLAIAATASGIARYSRAMQLKQPDDAVFLSRHL